MPNIPVGLEFRAEATKVRSEIRALRNDVRRFKDDVGASNRSSTRGFKQLEGSIKSALGALSVKLIADFIKEANQLAFELKNLQREFDILAKKSNTSSTALLKNLRSATRGMIPEIDLIRRANLALVSGVFDEKELTRLAENATRISQATGIAVTEVFDRLVRGITKVEPELLDELGLITLLDSAVKSYAAANNVSVASIGKVERSLIFKNEVLAEAERKFGDVIIKENEFIQSSVSATDAINELKVAVAEFLESDVVKGINLLTSGINLLTTALNELGGALRVLSTPALASDVKDLIELFIGAKSPKEFFEERGARDKLVTLKESEIKKNEQRIKDLNRFIQQKKSGTGPSQLDAFSLPVLEAERNFLSRRNKGLRSQILFLRPPSGVGTGIGGGGGGDGDEVIVTPDGRIISFQRERFGTGDGLGLRGRGPAVRGPIGGAESFGLGFGRGRGGGIGEDISEDIREGLLDSERSAKRFADSTSTFLMIATEQGLSEAFEASVKSAGFKLLQEGLFRLGLGLFSGGGSGLLGFLPFAGGAEDLSGGIRGRDSIPAMLMPGESVLTTGATDTIQKVFGQGFIEALNKASRRGFAGGVEAVQPLGGGGGPVVVIWQVDGQELDRRVIQPAQRMRERNLA